jgi:glycosyltransferase involved in cell wall biosynthesis
MEQVAPMKIAMITDTYDRIGGTEQAIKNTSRLLEAMGHQVRIIYSDRRYRLKGPLTELHRFDPEIVHVHTPGPLGNLGILYAKAKEVPVIGHFHSFPEVKFYFERDLEKKTIGEFLWKLVKHFYQACDLTIAPTEAVRRALEEKGFENLVVLHYGIDLRLFCPGIDGGIREGMGFTRRDIVAVYTGWFRKDKRVEVLVETAQELDPRFKFLLVGDGPTRKGVLREIRDQGIEGRVRILNPVPNHRLPGYYNAADLYANASISETLGISMVEAMACGKPVVASPSPGARDILLPGRNGLLAEDLSPEALSRAIALLEDPSKRAEMGRSSRKIAEERYEITKMVEGLLQIYQRVLEA